MEISSFLALIDSRIKNNILIKTYFKKSWIYKYKVLVFDFRVKDYHLAFDLYNDGVIQYKLDVFDRNNLLELQSSKNKYDFRNGKRYEVLLLNSCNLDIDLVVQKITEYVNLTIQKSISYNTAFDVLSKVIGAKDKINILDVGANPLTIPPYQKILDYNLCNIIGFEPQKNAFEELESNKSKNETYFNSVVGNGDTITLNIYEGSGFTSAFPLSKKTTTYLEWKSHNDQLIETERLKTVRIDDVDNLPLIDLFKIDIQGGELSVFKNSMNTLLNCVCVITEVNFLELYEENAPSFADIHQELVKQGFILHKFMFMKGVHIPTLKSNQNLREKYKNQLIDGDAVYIKDIRDIKILNSWELKSLAIFAGGVFQSPDLVLYCLEELLLRKEIDKDIINEYTSLLN